ncbi:serine/threonine protein kinase [Nannocystis sp. SCPEA4]|uniref:serine/threonine-protein kinase n=1 Tax=Nannocystis sp. SCPEA4 TaxID=2996787 RepID=UPI002270291D|nr:serine/threonine protein kinase [Nannocystis sp. SCPEA4]MCY1061375.1 protein kinase [Nannocystis sp. SCPEA4]
MDAPSDVTGTSEARAKVGDVLAQRWELREVLGAGALGRVFLAWDRERRQTCALKLFDGAAPPPEAFRRYGEALRSVAAVAHPALASLQAPVVAGGPRFVVGEALKGVDLEGLRTREGPVPWSRAAEIASVCADALAAVHEATGLAHRALKPGNVWITEASQVRLLDLGIAELALTPAAPRAGGIFVEYRAPEQIEGGPGDARSDVFTLAVLLFELLSGVHPFTGSSAFKAAHRTLQSPPELTADSVQALARPLLARALARRPEERFASAREFLRALTVVRQSVGSAAPRAAAAKSEPVADETTIPPPVPDSTTQIRVPVPRTRPPVAAPARGPDSASSFAAPLAPNTADVPVAGEPVLLGQGIDRPILARPATAKPAPLEPLPRVEPEASTERDARRPAAPETTLALPRLDATPRRPDAPDEDAATTALPVLRPRAHVLPDMPTQADADSDEMTVAMPERRPRSDEATVADDTIHHCQDMSARPAARTVESTFVLTDAADVGRAAPRPDEATLALSGAHPALGRPGAREPTAVLPDPTDMPQWSRHPQGRRADSPEEATQMVANLGAQVRAAARQPTAPPAPQAPPAEASWLSPRGLIAVNIVLGALILAALIVLLAR